MPERFDIGNEDMPEEYERFFTGSQLEGIATPRLLWALLLDDSALPAPARHLGLRLYLFAGKYLWCNPSVRRLAHNTGLSDSTVKRHLRLLADTGWLHIERHRKRNSMEWAANTYVLTWPHPIAFDDAAVRAHVEAIRRPTDQR